nr:hypothetical protein [Desulfobulbaceae bacterium]
MTPLNLTKVNPKAVETIRPFFEQILSTHQAKIHSLVVTGSAITEDFNSSKSDVNSIIILKDMDLKFLEEIAPLGKKFGKKKVAAPLIMTPDYITESLDVFPIEFLNFKIIHQTAYGNEILDSIEIERHDLRHQCEREIKTKLIGLRQGYLSSQADPQLLSEKFIAVITSDIPLFRALMFLLRQESVIQVNKVIQTLSTAVAINTDPFFKAQQIKQNVLKPSMAEFNTIFENYYSAFEKLGKIVNEISI